MVNEGGRHPAIGIAAAAVVDARGLVGTAGVEASWVEAGPLEAFRWRTVFKRPFKTFRRLDLLSRAACLAVEAAGLEALNEDAREATAIVLGSTYGCLRADLEFAASLAPAAGVAPAIFPYTLPSTCLGELALRHRLRGPTFCLSTAPGHEAQAVEEALSFLELGEAAAAVLCLGDALRPDDVAGATPLTLVALLLVPEVQAPRLPTLDELRAADDPVALLASRLRGM